MFSNLQNISDAGP